MKTISAHGVRARVRARGLTLHQTAGRWILSRHGKGKGPDARPVREILARAGTLADTLWALDQLPR